MQTQGTSTTFFSMMRPPFTHVMLWTKHKHRILYAITEHAQERPELNVLHGITTECIISPSSLRRQSPLEFMWTCWRTLCCQRAEIYDILLYVRLSKVIFLVAVTGRRGPIPWPKVLTFHWTSSSSSSSSGVVSFIAKRRNVVGLQMNYSTNCYCVTCYACPSLKVFPVVL